MPTSVSLTQLRHLIIDMDGVLYRGNTIIPGTKEFLLFVREIGVPFLLLTNNATLTRSQYVDKLAKMDVHVDEEEILTSAEATGMYLAKTVAKGTRMFMIGEDGLQTALTQRGFTLHNSTDVEYVVAGLDRHLTYEKLATATLAVRAGAKLIGCNGDKTLPTEAGELPGAGAIMAALEAATDTAATIIGKPQPAIFRLGLELLQAEAKTTASIGDRLETDILGGQQTGMPTILLLSGVTTRALLEKATLVPDLVYDNLGAVHQAWQTALRAARA